MADAFEIAFGILIIGMIVTFGCSLYDTANYTPVDIMSDNHIRSLNDGSRIYGSFSLGSGYIDQVPQFIFYQIDGNGYILRSVRSDCAKIIEDENEHPYIRQFIHYRIGHITGMKAYHGETYEFHVPNGTIVKEWKLNSEL